MNHNRTADKTALALEGATVWAPPGRLLLYRQSLCVETGERIRILGAAGSGKTSVFRVLAGAEKPQEGRVLWFGESAPDRSRIGVIPEGRSFLGDLTARENLRIFSGDVSKDDMDFWLEAMKVPAPRTRKIRDYRPAELARLALARAFMGRPELILADHFTRELGRKDREMITKDLEAALCAKETPERKPAWVHFTDQEGAEEADWTFRLDGEGGMTEVSGKMVGQMAKKLLLMAAVIFSLGLAPSATLRAESVTEVESVTETEYVTEAKTETETKAKAEAETEAESAADLNFSIEDSQVYDGMEKAYRKGYEPTVEDGKARIVLPLVADGEVKGEKITVTPELGDTENSPFHFKNYQKTVKLTEETTKSGKVRSVYLVQLTLTLNEDRTNGVYPVKVLVKARSGSGELVEQTFTSYVTIRDGSGSGGEETEEETEPEEEEGGGEEEEENSGGGGDESETKPQSQPMLLVSSYQTSRESLEAGEDFTVTVTLENTSKKIALQNAAVTVSTDNAGLEIKNPGSVIYIGSVKAGGTAEVVLDCAVRRDAAEGTAAVQLAMSYDNPDAETLSSSGSLSLTLTQPVEVEALTPVLPESVRAGDTFTVDLSVMNLGRSAIYNARYILDMPGLIPSGDTLIGNLEAGTDGGTSMKIYVSSRNKNSDGSERELEEDEETGETAGLYGETRGTLTLLYEDAAGKEYTEEFVLSTEIEPLVIETAAAQEETDTDGSALQYAIGVAAAIVVIGILAAFRVMKKIRKQAEEAVRKEEDE